MIKEIVLEKMKRYRQRDRNKVYVHMLLKPVWWWEKEREEVITDAMIIGELVHHALPRLLSFAREVCVRVYLPRLRYYNIDDRVWRRYVRRCNSTPRCFYVNLCGTADALYNSYPVELKTTRRNLSKPLHDWVLQATLYAFLYKKRAALVVINLVTGEERVAWYEPPAVDEVSDLILRWLQGRFPYRTLHTYNRRRK